MEAEALPKDVDVVGVAREPWDDKRFLALPPALFAPAIEGIAAAGLSGPLPV